MPYADEEVLDEYILDDDELQISDPNQKVFRDRLLAGRVVPIISDRAIFDHMLGGYVLFLNRYAEHIGYPKEMRQPCGYRYEESVTGDWGYVPYPAKSRQPDSLVAMVKYHKHRPRKKSLSKQALKYDYLNQIKIQLYRMARADGLNQDELEAAKAQQHKPVSEFAGILGYPHFTDREDPLLLLANLPVKIVLTTSPFTFMEQAFRVARKDPRTEVCRWTKKLQDSIPSVIDESFELDANEPLVYHLLGLDRYPDSLVLTEDDYLDYLGNICLAKGDQSADLVPALVRSAFSDDLIVLGFGLNSWAFRVLYAGLIKRSEKSDERGVCAIVLPDNTEEKVYLQDYIENEAKFQVFWGDMKDYAREELL